jgi:predicted RNase H-like HicB family nuclease
MARYTYPAIIKYDPEGPDYEVTFPDFTNISAVDNNLVGALELMNNVLFEEIESLIEMDEDLPEPTPFEQHLQQDEGSVSWWTIAHCDIDLEPIMERKQYIRNKLGAFVSAMNEIAPNENFERIMSGLHEVADMVNDRPVSVIGLEMSPSNTYAETVLGLIPGRW